MKNHDELMAMSQEERDEYLRVESQKIIDASPNPQKLTGLQWKLNQIRMKSKGNKAMFDIYSEMLNSLHELNDYLQQISKEK